MIVMCVCVCVCVCTLYTCNATYKTGFLQTIFWCLFRGRTSVNGDTPVKLLVCLGRFRDSGVGALKCVCVCIGTVCWNLSKLSLAGTSTFFPPQERLPRNVLQMYWGNVSCILGDWLKRSLNFPKGVNKPNKDVDPLVEEQSLQVAEAILWAS